METITCNKLSHCLFDFDCPDFEQYENEKYEHQTFTYHNLYANENEPKLLSLLDLSFHRNNMKIKSENNAINENNYFNKVENDKIILPFPTLAPEKKKDLIFRLVFKP